ncbi:MAG: CBS domain-containing protein, partial [Magnetococcales bacterium]|nr:CBS domain-containing protein [Magnetococcales bacterium]
MSIVRNCMLRDIATFSPSTSLMEVIRRMVRQSTGFSVVLDHMQLSGLLTDFDILKWMEKGVDLEKTHVGDIRLSKPQVVYEETDCQEFLNIYNTRRFRRFPVLTSEELLTGGITEKQILGSLPMSNLLGHYRVSDVVVLEPPEVPFDLAFNKAVKRMVRWHRGCLLVIKDRHLVGVVTERDLLRGLVRDDWNERLPVHEIMSTDLTTIAPDRDLRFAMDAFRRTGHRAFPVVDVTGRLLGLITQTDLLKQMAHSARSRRAVLNPEDIQEPAVWFEPDGEHRILAMNKRGAETLELDPDRWVGRSVNALTEDEKLWPAISTVLRNSGSIHQLTLPLKTGTGNPLCIGCRFNLVPTPTGED